MEMKHHQRDWMGNEENGLLEEHWGLKTFNFVAKMSPWHTIMRTVIFEGIITILDIAVIDYLHTKFRPVFYRYWYSPEFTLEFRVEYPLCKLNIIIYTKFKYKIRTSVKGQTLDLPAHLFLWLSCGHSAETMTVRPNSMDLVIIASRGGNTTVFLQVSCRDEKWVQRIRDQKTRTFWHRSVETRMYTNKLLNEAIIPLHLFPFHIILTDSFRLSVVVFFSLTR